MTANDWFGVVVWWRADLDLRRLVGLRILLGSLCITLFDRASCLSASLNLFYKRGKREGEREIESGRTCVREWLRHSLS